MPHLGDAPLADDGGMLVAHRRQVRRHAEGEGTEKGTVQGGAKGANKLLQI